MFEKESHEFTWHSDHLAIRIRVIYTPDWGPMEHLAITSLEPSKAALPISTTGSLSHFIPQGTAAHYGGPVQYTRLMLDHAAKQPEWQKHLVSSRQRSLF